MCELCEAVDEGGRDDEHDGDQTHDQVEQLADDVAAVEVAAGFGVGGVVAKTPLLPLHLLQTILTTSDGFLQQQPQPTVLKVFLIYKNLIKTVYVASGPSYKQCLIYALNGRTALILKQHAQLTNIYS